MLFFWHKFRTLWHGAPRPVLAPHLQKDLRLRLLNKIVKQAGEMQQAEALEKACKKHDSSDELAFLARELQALPAATPRWAWRVRVRERFATLRANWLTDWLQRLSAAAVALVLLAVINFAPFTQTPTALAAEIGELTVANGRVQIRAEDAVFFATVQTGEKVHVGDTIRVAAGGAAQITLQDKTEVQIKEKTEVAVNWKAQPKTPPQVELAVLAGDIATTPAAGSAGVSITTAAGDVTTPAGEFAVTVNPLTGQAAVAPGHPVQIAQVSNLPTTPLAADILTPPSIPEAATPALETPPLAEVTTTLDLAEIRLLDALTSAEAGNATNATGTAAQVAKNLTDLAQKFQILATEDSLSTLAPIFAEKFGTTDAHQQLTTYTTKIGKLQALIQAYTENPVFLRGKPEFVLLEQEHFAISSGALRPVLLALHAEKLAAPAAQQLASSLVQIYTQELQNSWPTAPTARRQFLEGLLSQMDAQPIFLPVLHQIADSLPAEERASVQTKSAQLEKVLAEYAGG